MLRNKLLQTYIITLDQHSNRIVYLITFIFLFAGFIYSLHLGNELRFPDEKQYHLIAEHIANGTGFSIVNSEPTAARPPLYPVFLSLAIYMGAPIILLRYLNFCILALCLYVIRSILRHENVSSGSGLSAIFFLGYGVLFYTAGTLYPQTLFTLLLLCIIRLIISKSFGYSKTVLFGLLSGLIILTHPTGIFIPPLAVIWRFYPRNYHIIWKGLIAAVITVGCISIWSYRNYVIFDRFIPFTSHGGDTLYIGNNPNTSVASWHSYYEKGLHLEASKLPEYEGNRYYLKKTIQFWTEHTGQAIQLYLYKVVYHFNFRNTFTVKSQNRIIYDIIMFATYYPLLICLVLRILYAIKFPLTRTESLLVTIYLVSALFHAIFLPRIRFRLPYDAVLICHIGIMYSILAKKNYAKSR